MKDLVALFKSFGYAFEGVFTAIKTERNMRIHISCFVYMFFFLFAFDFFEITRTQFAILFIACGLVMGAELINTSIEAVIDLHGEKHTEFGKIAKDCAAGAVLIFTIFAVLAGVAIMWQPKAFQQLFQYFTNNLLALGLFIVSIILDTIFIFFGFEKKGKNK